MAVPLRQRIRYTPLIIAAAFAVTWGGGAWLGHSQAAPFQAAFLRLDTLRAAQPTGGRVCVRPATAATEASVQVTFPTTAATDYIVNATAANWTVNTTGLDTGQTAWIGIGTATNVTGKTVTFPSGDLVVGTLYCFNFSATNTLTTSSAGAAETTHGSITTRTSVPATIDTSLYSQSIITDDRVVYTATVPPSFSFVLNGNTDSFSTNLSPSSVVSTGGRTIQITTNAYSGWVVWARGLNSNAGRGSLRSATAGNYNITGTGAVGSAARTLTTGTEDYGLGVTVDTDAAGGGTVSVDAAYVGTSSQAGTLDASNFRPIAASNGVANGDIIRMNGRATIAGMTPAASDYTDTVTYVGAGQF